MHCDYPSLQVIELQQYTWGLFVLDCLKSILVMVSMSMVQMHVQCFWGLWEKGLMEQCCQGIFDFLVQVYGSEIVTRSFEVYWDQL
jgi:hypothetical protein